MIRMNRQHPTWSMSHDTSFSQLLSAGVTPEALHAAVAAQRVEIVLTAHPTQVNRRTLQYKHMKIASILEKNDRPELPPDERDALLEDLVRELLSLWQTDELRRRRPTPLDEARGGLHIVEQSLWTALPAYLRRLSGALKRHTGAPLPLDACPVRFASWMGGDRDGNPNVTARVTHHVSCLSRWMAADLYIHEVDTLRFELSMARASPELLAMASAIEAQEEAAYQELHKQPSGVAAAAAAASAAAAATHAANAAVNAAAAASAAVSASPGPTPSGLGRTLSRRSTGSGERASGGMGGMGGGMGGGWGEDGHPPQGMVISTLLGGAFDSEAVHVPHSAAEQDPFAWREIAEQLEADEAAAAAAAASKRSSVASLTSLDAPPSPPAHGIAGGASDGSASSVPPLTPGLAKKGPGKSGDASADGEAGKGGRGKGAAMETLLHPAKLMGGTPYRSVLGHVRAKLVATRHRMEDLLSGVNPSCDDYYASPEELMAPLRACYDSLHASGAGPVAEGRLTDVIRRVASFGLSLLKLDLRQEAPRHTDALDAVTTYLGLGSYAEWDETRRAAWLAEELGGRRPLVPHAMPVSAAVREVLETFRVAAELGPNALGAYVISMAGAPSDVLAVELLQREARAVVASEASGSGVNAASCGKAAGGPLRVVPLFETLRDLQAAPAALEALFSIPWYRKHLVRDAACAACVCACGVADGVQFWCVSFFLFLFCSDGGAWRPSGGHAGLLRLGARHACAALRCAVLRCACRA
jgi:hypothetical protein